MERLAASDMPGFCNPGPDFDDDDVHACNSIGFAQRRRIWNVGREVNRSFNTLTNLALLTEIL